MPTSGAPVAAYREQTVEIALGPKGAFENGNIGTLTRRVATVRVVSAFPTRPRQPHPPPKTKDAPSGRTPPKSHRVEGSPGIRQDRQPGRYCSPGGHHPRPGDTGHGPACGLHRRSGKRSLPRPAPSTVAPSQSVCSAPLEPSWINAIRYGSSTGSCARRSTRSYRADGGT